jgi:hypothetical protein
MKRFCTDLRLRVCVLKIYGSLFKNKPPTNSLLAQIQIRQSVKDMYLYFLLQTYYLIPGLLCWMIE